MPEYHGDIVRETDAAWLFYCNESGDEIWLPKSQCDWDEYHGIMKIPNWLAREKDLI